MDAWHSLFAFAPTVLAKPTRGGSDRNLANAFLKNQISCNDAPSAKTILIRQQRHLSRTKHDAMLAAAITSKVEAGNFRAVVRLLCSEEKLASSSDDTFEAPKAKYPSAPQDRRPAAEFKGNLRFSPLQTSSEDAIKTLRTFCL